MCWVGLSCLYLLFLCLSLLFLPFPWLCSLSRCSRTHRIKDGFLLSESELVLGWLFQWWEVWDFPPWRLFHHRMREEAASWLDLCWFLTWRWWCCRLAAWHLAEEFLDQVSHVIIDGIVWRECMDIWYDCRGSDSGGQWLQRKKHLKTLFSYTSTHAVEKVLPKHVTLTSGKSNDSILNKGVTYHGHFDN